MIEGRAKIRVADEDREVGPGALIFVPAKAGHRFHDIEADLVVLVVFVPPET